ncbi:MAG: ACP S-malonyltransferase [Marinicella sp.]|nr:ACP S-malonyltransferase [Xanthomonadales bacterium]
MNKIAFVFPGQGSQSVGMLDALTDYPEVAACFAVAHDVLGVDLLKMVNQGPAEELNKTQWTQPALLAASVGIYQAIKARKELPVVVMAGHSLGEYSALVCADSLDLATALQLVHKRGTYMQSAVPAGKGSMAAVLGLEAEAIEQACEQAQQQTGEAVSPANFNSPGQIVIAGAVDAVAKAGELCSEAGAKRVMPLAVSVPSHCELMRPAAEQLAKDLEGIEFKVPAIDVLHNVNVASHANAQSIKAALVAQLYSPVKWTQTMETLQKLGVDTVAECGPGKVLSGLFKRFDRNLNAIPLLNSTGIEQILGAE